MSTNRGISSRHIEQSDEVKKSAYCGTPLDVNDEVCGICGHNIEKTRICPYCQTTLPAEEDPCHNCERWEPADEETLRAYYKRETHNDFVWWLFALVFDGILSGILNIIFQ